MWSAVLKILSILGIILLCLLALVLVTLLLVLFWPVSYRGGGSAREGEYQCWFRFRWLFGLVRGAYAYPESGGLQVKMLWLTVYDSRGKRQKTPPEDESSEQDEEERAQSGKSPVVETRRTQSGQSTVKAEEQISSERPDTETEEQTSSERPGAETEEQTSSERPGAETEEQTSSERPSAETEEQTSSERPGVKTEEQKAHEQGRESPKQSAADRVQSLSEKMSGLNERLQFYLDIVRDEENQGLVKHGLIRLGKILRSIRPRFLRAEALIGLKEPDLTGYVYGIYWAIKPFLGKKCHVAVTPDFEKQVLEGEFILGGRIMVATLLHHVIRVLVDKRLRRLLNKIKKQ